MKNKYFMWGNQNNQSWICSAWCNLFSKAEERKCAFGSHGGALMLSCEVQECLFLQQVAAEVSLSTFCCGYKSSGRNFAVTPLALWQLGNSLILRLFLVNLVLLASVPLYVAVTVWSSQIGELDSAFQCLCSAKYVHKNR